MFLPEEPEVNISVFESVWYFDRNTTFTTFKYKRGVSSFESFQPGILY